MLSPRTLTCRAALLVALSTAACADVTITGVADGGMTAGPGSWSDDQPAPAPADFFTRPDDGGASERPLPGGSAQPVVFGGDAGAVTAPGAPSTSAVCRKESTADPRLELLDDLEDGDRNLPPQGDRTGYWSASHDDTAGGVQVPDPFAASEIVGCGARGYAHLRGKGFKNWGAQLYVYFNRDKSGYDLGSRYEGIAFWARSSAGTKVRVMLPNRDTDPSGGVCSSASGNAAPACHNHFHQELTFGNTWRHHTVLFKNLKQAAFWGKPVPAFDARSVISLLFLLDKDVTYDLWIDDVALIKR